MGDKIREQQRNQRPRAPRRLRARAPSARGASSSRRPPQRCGDVEAVIRRRGFADFVDVDAVVTDKNGPQHGLLFLVTDRASGCRLAPRWGLGGGLRFLDLAFEIKFFQGFLAEAAWQQGQQRPSGGRTPYNSKPVYSRKQIQEAAALRRKGATLPWGVRVQFKK